MADVLDIDNAEEFEVDDEGDRKYHFWMFASILHNLLFELGCFLLLYFTIIYLCTLIFVIS